MTNCILNDRHKTGSCSACPPTCQHRIATDGRIKLAGAPASYRHLTLANSPAREGQAAVYAKVDEYALTFRRMFDADERIKSLYLFSKSPGTGKTTTATAVMNTFIVEHYLGALKRGLKPQQMPAYFLDVNEWQTLFNEFNRKHIPQEVAEKASAEYYSRMQKAKTAPLAVLDDIGVRSATEAFRGDLHAIINYRVTNGLPTVYTSNLPIVVNVPPADRVDALKPYDLFDVFEARLADRIREQCEFIPFEGRSKRK